MGKLYSEEKMKSILKNDITPSSVVDLKMEEAYGIIRSQPARKTGKRRSYKKYLAIAAAAALVAATSIVALAANGFFSKEVIKEEQGSASYKFHIDYSLTVNPIVVTPGYIPEGYVERETGKYDKDGKRKNGISIAALNSVALDSMGGNLDVENTSQIEETSLNGMEAHIITWNLSEGRKGFNKRIYLFNPDDGYVVIVYGGDDISVEELKKVADNLKVEKDETTQIEYDPKGKALDEEAALNYQKDFEKEKTEGISAERIIPLGVEENSPMSYVNEDGKEGKLSFTVKNAKFVDSLEGFPKENFFDYENNVLPFLNEDQTAKPYQNCPVNEEGMVIPGEATTVRTKFLVVDVEVKNYGDETTYAYLGLNWASLNKREDGKYQKDYIYRAAEDSYFLEMEPLYFSDPVNIGTPEKEKQIFFRNVAAGETQEYTLIFNVDEQDVDSSYLFIPSGNSEDEFTHTYLALK